jgi:hypothetical protein
MQNSLIMNMNYHFVLPESCVLAVVTAGFARFASGDHRQDAPPHQLGAKWCRRAATPLQPATIACFACYSSGDRRQDVPSHQLATKLYRRAAVPLMWRTKSVKDVFGQSVKDVGLHIKSGVINVKSHAGLGGLGFIYFLSATKYLKVVFIFKNFYLVTTE